MIKKHIEKAVDKATFPKMIEKIKIIANIFKLLMINNNPYLKISKLLENIILSSINFEVIF